MPVSATTYDLVLVLDPQAADDARAKLVADTRSAIEGQGELQRHDAWGERALAYPIDRRTTGEYHLFQFHPSGTKLLGELDHTLRIADDILRFRIIKLKPGVPEAPDMGAAARRAEPEAQPAATPAEPAQPDAPPPEADTGEPVAEPA
jgi:small subunit ribosomal protein S6